MQVKINNVLVPIYYVIPRQLAVLVPYSVTSGIATVQVINNNVPSNTVTVFVGKTAPGVFTRSQDGLGYGDIEHADGSLVNAQNPAQIGEIVAVYLTGLGAVSPPIIDGDVGPTNPLAKTPDGAIAAYIGGVSAPIGYSGLAPTLAGLYQMNLTVPAGVAAGDHYLDIAGPDAYSSECVIAIGPTPSSAPEAVQLYRAAPHARPHGGTIVPTRR